MVESTSEQRQLMAIMFTDMVGFSAVSQRNEALAMELLEAQRSIVRAAVALNDGHEVKTTGDGFLIKFTSALNAVRCAMAVQTTVSNRNQKEPEDRRFQLRIGIHVGDVIVSGNDVAGDGVNLASRIEPLALPGGICVTGPVAEQVWNKLSAQLVSAGRPKLKNIDAPVEVFRVVLPGQPVPAGRSAYRPRHAAPVSALTVVIASLAIAAGVFLVGPLVRSRKAPPGSPPSVDPRAIHSLAVLPLRNYTGDPQQVDFIAGLTDSLTTDVSHIRSLRVVSYQSSRQVYGDGARTIPQLAKDLNVDALLEGSVQKAGAKFLINVQLIHGPTDQHLWAEKFEEEGGDLLDAQNRIVLAVADKLKTELTGDEKQRFAAARKSDPEALKAYYEGRSRFVKSTADGYLQSISLYNRALKSDPNLAIAYAGIADSYAALSNVYVAPMEAMPKAEAAADKALSLQPELAEALAAKGWVLAMFHYNLADGLAKLEMAVRVNPSYSTGHMYLGLLLAQQRRSDDAIANLKKALELEPTSPLISFNLEWAYFIAKRFDDTISQAKHTLTLDPNYWDSHQQMGLALFYKGDRVQGLRELELAARKQPDSVNVTNYALALSMVGKKAEAASQLARFLKDNGAKYVCAYEVASSYEAMGNRAQALSWMKKGYGQRCDCLVWGGIEPWLEQLRKDNEFKAILAEAGILQ
jgi:adenylate cyclase